MEPGMKRLTLRTAMITALVAVPTAVIALSVLPSQAATPVAGGVYTLVPGASGKCLNVVGASTANAALLEQVACAAGATSQHWRVTSAGSGIYTLQNVNSGRCVDVPSGTATSGLRLQQWGCA